MAQLPQAAQGAVMAILVYTILCLLCNMLMLWLLWTSRQLSSHIGLICVFTLICVCVNIIQQVYDNIYWVDVQTAKFNHIKANVGNPLLAASNGVTGLDLALWAMRFGSETVAACQACCWAFSLTQAVYGWAKWADWILINNCGKVTSIVLPIIFLGVLHLDSVQQATALFYFLLDVLFFGAIAGGALGLLLILAKYIHTRRQLKLWELATRVDGHTTWRSFRLSDDAPADQMPAQGHSMGIYDNWLLVRFSVAFFFMIAFELDTIVIQIDGHRAMQAAAAASAPNLSASQAIKHFALLIPSAFASVLGLFTFGTTSHFRDTIYATLIPRRWQRRTRQQPDPESDAAAVARQVPRVASTSSSSSSSSSPTSPPPPVASRDAEASISGNLGRRFAYGCSWEAKVRTSGSSGIPLQALDDIPQSPDSAATSPKSRAHSKSLLSRISCE